MNTATTARLYANAVNMAPAGWTINCDYWCAKIDGKGTSCGGGDDDAQEASFRRQTIESVAPATVKKAKLGLDQV